MGTPAESAHLILKLYELRREELLRKARAWFGSEFNPATYEEFSALVAGGQNVYFRMVLGYWDMAASLVTAGAIDQAMFQATGGELIFSFAKIEPFIAQYRVERGDPHYLANMEEVARAFPGADERMARIRQRYQAAALAQSTRGRARKKRR